MLSARTILAAGVTLALSTASVTAAESWNCTTHLPQSGGTEVTPGHAQVQIGDNFVVSFSPDRNGFFSKYQARLLVNNDVGAVAAFAQATNTPPSLTVKGLPERENEIIRQQLLASVPNPLVNAYIFVLSKHDGSLRSGYVGTNGAHDDWTGECQMTPSTPPAAQGVSH